MATLQKRLFSGILAGILLALSAPVPAADEPVASATVKREFASFLARFRAALAADDAGAVAGMTQFPFMAYTDNGSDDAAGFRAKSYPRFFTTKTRRCLARTEAIYDREPEGGENFVMFCGNLGFYFHKTQAGFLFTEVGSND